MKSPTRTVRLVTVVAIAVVAALSLGASRAWSDAGGAAIEAAATCPSVGCVASSGGDFCLCKSGVDVCTGERAVDSCSARVETGTGTCCLSAGTCYCTREAHCTFDDDVPTNRCDTTLVASGPRCAVISTSP